MSNRVSGMNPRILRWARHTAGLSTGEVAAKLGKDAEIIEGWEAGVDVPTYVQLETLAYSVFKRPIALFFFPEPPEEPTLEQAFRTLPDFELASLDPATRQHIREARALQLALHELNDGENPSERQIHRDVAVDAEQSASQAAAEVRTYLGISLEAQIRWRTDEEALDEWRAAVEDAGVYVFKNSIPQREVSGFCLYDEEFPIIYINNSTAKTRQIFTLFHELAHVLLSTSSVTKLDDQYIRELAAEEKKVELFCNRFAAEFLLPEKRLRAEVAHFSSLDDELIERLANRYHVSREFVLRGLLDMGAVSHAQYERAAARWNQEYEAQRSGSGGGNYYSTQVSYLGDKYLGLTFGRFYQGAITLGQLADYLGVKAKNIPTLEQKFLQRAVR